MGTDLSKPLNRDLAEGLDLNLAPSDPLFAAVEASGALAFWDPRFNFGLNGSKLATWVDRIGGYSLANGVDASRPVYEATGPSSTGVPAVNFAGGNYWLENSHADILAAGNSNECGMVYAFRCDNVGQQGLGGWFGPSATSIRYAVLDGTSALNSYYAIKTGTMSLHLTGLPTANTDAWGGYFSEAADDHHSADSRGLTNTSTTTVTFGGDIDAFELGRRGDNATQYSAARMYAAILYSNVPDAATLLTVYDALEAYVGIT